MEACYLYSGYGISYGNDTVDYVDPDGELPHILGGALLGGFIGGAGRFISSAVSQKLGGGKVDWEKAKGEAIKGAITGAVQGGMVASGVKIPKAVANAANFLAGTIGSAAEQKIARGRVSIGRSILGGIANVAFYGFNKGIVELWDGFRAGKDSRVTINNQADFVVALGGVAYTAADYAKMSSFECPSTLYLYTTKTGMRGILESQQINPSIKELAVKDARMGSGQYLTDIIPGSRTKGQISYALFGIPWNTGKVSNYIEISTSNLNLLKGREGIYYVPSTSALDLTNRIISYGETGKGG